MNLVALIGSGRAIEVILALMLLEGGALALWYRRTGRGVAPGDLLTTLLAGAALLLALRAALVGGGPILIGLWLFVALLGHLADLARRWRR